MLQAFEDCLVAQIGSLLLYNRSVLAEGLDILLIGLQVIRKRPGAVMNQRCIAYHVSSDKP